MQWAVTRDREPIKDAASIKVALHKWILPAIGDMPLGSVNNITIKPVVDKMKKSRLSARTANKAVEFGFDLPKNPSEKAGVAPIAPR